MVLLNFIFTHCAAACPLQTQRLKHLKRQIDAEHPDVDLRLVSVSLTPEQDTPEVLAHYGNAQGISADGTWRLLTGDTVDVNTLMALLGMKATFNDAETLDHLTNLYLFDRAGLLVKRYDGMSDSAVWLANHIVALSRVAPRTENVAIPTSYTN